MSTNRLNFVDGRTGPAMMSLGCTLSIESGVDIQSSSPWETLCFLTQAGRARVIAEASGTATPKLYRYLRWRVEEGNDPWTVCFKADVVEK